MFGETHINNKVQVKVQLKTVNLHLRLKYMYLHLRILVTLYFKVSNVLYWVILINYIYLLYS